MGYVGTCVIGVAGELVQQMACGVGSVARGEGGASPGKGLACQEEGGEGPDEGKGADKGLQIPQ